MNWNSGLPDSPVTAEWRVYADLLLPVGERIVAQLSNTNGRGDKVRNCAADGR